MVASCATSSARSIPRSRPRVFAATGTTPDDYALFVVHQVTAPFADEMVARLGFPPARVERTIEAHGNVALGDAAARARVRPRRRPRPPRRQRAVRRARGRDQRRHDGDPPVSGGATRFDRVEGRPLVELPPFRLEDRPLEVLVPGEAEAWITLPALDEAAGIGATLAALEAQTLRPLVVCVVDNGSRDATVELVRALGGGARNVAGGPRPRRPPRARAGEGDRGGGRHRDAARRRGRGPLPAPDRRRQPAAPDVGRPDGPTPRDRRRPRRRPDGRPDRRGQRAPDARHAVAAGRDRRGRVGAEEPGSRLPHAVPDDDGLERRDPGRHVPRGRRVPALADRGGPRRPGRS